MVLKAGLFLEPCFFIVSCLSLTSHALVTNSVHYNVIAASYGMGIEIYHKTHYLPLRLQPTDKSNILCNIGSFLAIFTRMFTTQNMPISKSFILISAEYNTIVLCPPY